MRSSSFGSHDGCASEKAPASPAATAAGLVVAASFVFLEGLHVGVSEGAATATALLDLVVLPLLGAEVHLAVGGSGLRLEEER